MHLARPAQVASYKGFIFATLNSEAPPLAEHLGNATRYLDAWIEHNGGAQNIVLAGAQRFRVDRKSTRLNSSHLVISYAVFCLKKKTQPDNVADVLLRLVHRRGVYRLLDSPHLSR